MSRTRAKITWFVERVSMALANEYQRPALFRLKGADIGQGCRILVNTLGSEPYLVTIGDETLISGGVLFLTHDAGTWVFRREHPEAARFGRITVGSRVFIGSNAILLPGVTVGDRSIIGAGAVVTRDVEPGTVVAGVPARVVSTVESYRQRTLRDFPRLETAGPDGGPDDLRGRLLRTFPK
jgi:acetyltransferase-like isoleucine patch superfamily enzyme